MVRDEDGAGGRLAVAYTWDGAPRDEAAIVDWELGAAGLVVRVEAPFHGDPAPAAAVGRTDRLWEHEVVELFLAERAAREARYLEIELGPHGHWLALGFDGYRRRAHEDLALTFEAAIDGPRWSGCARMSAGEIGRVLSRVGAANAYAIHGAGASRVYLAAHPAPAGLHAGPDFHRLERFAAVGAAR